MLTVAQLVKKYFDLLWDPNGRDSLQLMRGVANILNKQSQSPENGWSSSLGLRVGLTTPHRKNMLVT
jgi:hypothetical protein